MKSRPFHNPSFEIGVFEIYNGHNPLFKLKEDRVYVFPFVKNEISDFTEEVTNEDENGRISSFINQDR
jgi:hypothetical protein